MRNPLSLHSGLGSLLFLSLVPVALSLPTGPNYGWSPYGFQNHDFQNQNLNQWPPSSLQSVVTQQGPNVPQHGLPQQHLSSFGNTPQLAQNPPGFSSTSHPLSGAEMDDIILATAFHDLSGGVPLISPSSPSSHAGWYPSSSEAHGFLESRPSYNHAVELRQNAEGALQRQNEPDVPPHGSAATAMHNRVSNEGASSSRKIYTTPEELEKYGQDRQEFVQEPEALHKFRYSASPFEDVPAPIGRQRGNTHFHHATDSVIFNDINTKIFGGKLMKVDVSKLQHQTRQNQHRAIYQPSRVLPFVTLKPQLLEGGAGVIDRVRMTVHQMGYRKNQAPSVERSLEGKTLYNFWGIPENSKSGSRRIVIHYGMGYVEPGHFEAVNNHLKATTRGAEAAAHFH
ncbi:uncharacterized protein UBRO_15858 [Ustilago bromivora]|uniref:Effector family protein Eff1 n=1 Tax=Ustilago bromivora TaxID=307758 RepID=A0A1K0G1X6_9BASI|nr:uncharacterized protein UBRO_15858 [Ustilago bromivora]